jgi:hypothetical protein
MPKPITVFSRYRDVSALARHALAIGEAPWRSRDLATFFGTRAVGIFFARYSDRQPAPRGEYRDGP